MGRQHYPEVLGVRPRGKKERPKVGEAHALPPGRPRGMLGIVVQCRSRVWGVGSKIQGLTSSRPC